MADKLGSQPASVPIYWQDSAGIGDDAIRRYFQAVAPIYAPMVLNAQPMPDGPNPTSPYLNIVFTKHPLGNDATLDGGAGFSIPAAHRAYVFLNNTDQFGNQRDAAAAEALGHEIGHLLGLGHTLSGIMNPNISQASMVDDMHQLDKGQLKKAERSAIALHQLAQEQ